MNEKITVKLDGFFGDYPERRVSKGTILIHAHENPPGIIRLRTGAVGQYDIGKQGQKITVNVFRPPAFFPMSWAVNKTPNTYFFEALETVRYRAAPPDKTVEFLLKNPDVLLNLLGRVYRGLDGLLGRMAYLMSSDARTRLLFELLIICRRFGRQQPDGSWIIQTKETDLAAHTGLARETVSRLLQKIAAEGFVKPGRGRIIIPSLEAIEGALGTD